MSPRAGQRSEQNHTQTAADREREQNDRKPRRRLLPSDAQLRLSGTHYRKLSSTVTLLLCLRIVERHSYSPGLSLFPLPSNTLHGPSTSEVTTLWRYTNLFYYERCYKTYLRWYITNLLGFGDCKTVLLQRRGLNVQERRLTGTARIVCGAGSMK